MDQNTLRSIDDCKVTELGIASDHSGLLLLLNICCSRKTQKRKNDNTKWETLIDTENRKHFNQSLDSIVKDNCNLTEFCEAMHKARKLALENEENDNPR